MTSSTEVPGPADGMPRPGADPVARVTDLHVSFRRGDRTVQALRGVDLEIRQGEILALVGESGSGKSVLGMSLLGLPPMIGHAPEMSGSIEVCGVEMITATDRERRRVRKEHLGAVFQDPMTSLNPTMRLEQQLVETCGSSEEAVRLLEAVGVPQPRQRLKVFPHELSGGMRQRVMIAMALGGGPRLVIADEPTTALDVSVQAQIVELLRHLCDELGTSFLFVTHDLGVAADLADRIAVLYAGRMAELGSCADILERPHHPYSIALQRSRLGLTTPKHGPLRALPGSPPDPVRPLPGCAFAPRCEHVVAECSTSTIELVDVASSAEHRTACIRHDAVARAVVGEGPADAARAIGSMAVPVRILAPSRAAGTASPAAVADPTADPVLVDVTAASATVGKAPVLQVHDLHVSYPLRNSGRRRARVHALRGVDLSVARGEAVAVVGESGCGKSTLLRVVAGLVGADSGTVTLESPFPQMVFQEAGASLTPWLSIGQILSDRIRRTHPGRAERARVVEETLVSVGLAPEIAHARPRQLSGGQRQRVALARAMIIPPPVLLCDEPTSALDVSLAATVLNLLGELRARTGTAMLFVTHDLAAARYVADRIVVMYLGEIVEEGSATDVVERPRHPYTEALLSAVPGRGITRIQLEGDPASPEDPPSGCGFHPRCGLVEAACCDAPPPLVAEAAGSAVRCLVRTRADRRERESVHG